MCIRAPTNSAASIIRRLAINASPTAFCASLEGLQPPNEIRLARRERHRACRLSGLDRARRRRSRATSISARSWCGCATTCRRMRSSPTAPAISPPGSTASIASANTPPMSAPTSGSMGYGFPAAVAMKTLHPDRTVVCVAGDGDFLMTGQDFATAVQYKLPVIVVLSDNGLYGTIRMHQERDYPGRVVATDAAQSRLRRLCQGLRRLRRAGGEDRRFPGGLCRAQKSGMPSIIHLKVDPEAITPAVTLTGIREKALAGGGRAGHIGAESLAAAGNDWRACFFAVNHHSLVSMPYRRTENVVRRLAARELSILARRHRARGRGRHGGGADRGGRRARRDRRRHGLSLFPVQDRSDRRTGRRRCRPRTRRHEGGGRRRAGAAVGAGRLHRHLRRARAASSGGWPGR